MPSSNTRRRRCRGWWHRLGAASTTASMEDLFNAVLAGDVEALERLARGGADLNATDEGGDPPLCLAARGGNLAIVRRLLDLGADPNFGTYALPLVEAAGGGHAPI